MSGQLWQECSCGTEPCCVDCEKCERHCKCHEERPARPVGPAPVEVFAIGTNRTEDDL